MDPLSPSAVDRSFHVEFVGKLAGLHNCASVILLGVAQPSTPNLIRPACIPDEYAPVSTDLFATPTELENAAKLFRLLSNPARLMLVAQLAEGDASVTKLADVAEESLVTISERLRLLHDENIVVRKGNGRQNVYSLANQHIIDLVRNVLLHAAEPISEGTLSG